MSSYKIYYGEADKRHGYLVNVCELARFLFCG